MAHRLSEAPLPVETEKRDITLQPFEWAGVSGLPTEGSVVLPGSEYHLPVSFFPHSAEAEEGGRFLITAAAYEELRQAEQAIPEDLRAYDRQVLSVLVATGSAVRNLIIQVYAVKPAEEPVTA